MNIVDYCAQKAYNVYSNNYLRDNKDNLENIEKLNYQNSEDFITNFSTDLRKNISTVLNDYPADSRDNVRHSLTQILKSNFDNLQDNNIVDHSGKINVGIITKTLNEGIKKRLPEVYQRAQEEKQINTSNGNVNSTQKTVDFNNPEEKKAFFDNLYKGFAECKTREDKINYIQNEMGIDLGGLSDEEQDKVIDQFKQRSQIREIKDNLDVEKLRKENPDLDENELDQLLEGKAVQQYAEENDKDVDTVRKNNDMMIELENTVRDIKLVEEELSTCNDEQERIGITNNLTEIREKQNELIKILSLTKEEVEKISEDSKTTNEEKNDNISFYFTDTEAIDLSDFFYTDEKELEGRPTELIDMGEINKEPEIEPATEAIDIGTINEELEKEETKTQSGVNSILAGNFEENEESYDDLDPSNYTKEIEEKQGLWSKIKNRFSAIKNKIMDKLNLNNNRLKGQEYLDTAKNNTTNVGNDGEINNDKTNNPWKVDEYELAEIKNSGPGDNNRPGNNIRTGEDISLSL